MLCCRADFARTLTADRLMLINVGSEIAFELPRPAPMVRERIHRGMLIRDY